MYQFRPTSSVRRQPSGNKEVFCFTITRFERIIVKQSIAISAIRSWIKFALINIYFETSIFLSIIFKVLYESGNRCRRSHYPSHVITRSGSRGKGACLPVEIFEAKG